MIEKHKKTKYEFHKCKNCHSLDYDNFKLSDKDHAAMSKAYIRDEAFAIKPVSCDLCDFELVQVFHPYVM